MGVDVYIEARIRERESRRLITLNVEGPHWVGKDDEGYFKICHWRERRFDELIGDIIGVCMEHDDVSFDHPDSYEMPIPLSALYDIYTCILKHSAQPIAKTAYYQDDFGEEAKIKEGVFDWLKLEMYIADEALNLKNAANLHKYLLALHSIQCSIQYSYRGKFQTDGLDEMVIPDKNDLEHFIENPQDYNWEFRMVRS